MNTNFAKIIKMLMVGWLVQIQLRMGRRFKGKTLF